MSAWVPLPGPVTAPRPGSHPSQHWGCELGERSEGGLGHPGKVASQRPGDRTRETERVRHQRWRGGKQKRAENRETPETNKVTMLGTGEEKEGPQRQTGELETPTEREEKNREEETLQSEGGTVRHRGPWGM